MLFKINLKQFLYDFCEGAGRGFKFCVLLACLTLLLVVLNQFEWALGFAAFGNVLAGVIFFLFCFPLSLFLRLDMLRETLNVSDVSLLLIVSLIITSANIMFLAGIFWVWRKKNQS